MSPPQLNYTCVGILILHSCVYVLKRASFFFTIKALFIVEIYHPCDEEMGGGLVLDLWVNLFGKFHKSEQNSGRVVAFTELR